MFAYVVATPGIQIIDVRSPEEFAQGHIEGAVNYNVQGPDFGAQISALDPAGVPMPSIAGAEIAPSQQLLRCRGIGINGIFELESGIVSWEDAGFPVVS